MEITTMYQKDRRDFGRPVNTFAPSDVYILDEFQPEPELRATHIERNPTVLDVQAQPELSENYVNTETIIMKPQGMLHQEGGWPKEVDWTEKEHTVRYRKKVEKDEEYIKQLRQCADYLQSDIMQNYSIDIYEEYFANSDEATDYHSEAPSAKTLAVFKDPQESKRSVTKISWHPDAGRKLACSFAIMQFQDPRAQGTSMDSYIWDVNNPNTPETKLKPPSSLCCLEYNPKDPHLLVGGSYNGLITYYDTRTGESPKETSAIESSHRDPVYWIAWLHGKTPFECVSTSTDGQVLWWDVRKLGEPIDSMWVYDKAIGFDINSPNASSMGGTSMEYSGAGGKFIFGSEGGKIVACSRKGKAPADKIGNVLDAHSGPIYAIQRNAYFPKFYVTVGDWTVKVWNEELRTPIMTSKYFSSYVLDAAWSQTRPGVFITSKMDGTLDVWDIFHKQGDPTLTMQVDTEGLKCLRIQEAGSLVATGTVDGSIYMLELSEGLAQIQNNEKASVMAMLERESKREKNLEARAKELRAKEKRAAEMANSQPVAGEPWEDTVKGLEATFWDAVGGKADEEPAVAVPAS